MFLQTATGITKFGPNGNNPKWCSKFNAGRKMTTKYNARRELLVRWFIRERVRIVASLSPFRLLFYRAILKVKYHRREWKKFNNALDVSVKSPREGWLHSGMDVYWKGYSNKRTLSLLQLHPDRKSHCWISFQSSNRVFLNLHCLKLNLTIIVIIKIQRMDEIQMNLSIQFKLFLTTIIRSS